jgi:hypothetical protein
MRKNGDAYDAMEKTASGKILVNSERISERFS